MPRVISGTAQNLRRIGAAEVEQRTYLEHIDLQGEDLTGRDLADADLIDCNLQGVTWPVGATDYLMIRVRDPAARLTALDGSVIPVATSSYNHHFVYEVLRQASNTHHPGIKLIVEHVGADYRHSWQDSIWKVRTELGMSLAEIDAMLAVAFQGYPRLLERLRWHIEGGHITAEPPDTEWEFLEFEVGGIDVQEPIATLGLGDSLDRYDTERRLETALSAKHGVAVRVKVMQLHPHPIIFAAGSNVSPDYARWWRDRWPA